MSSYQEKYGALSLRNSLAERQLNVVLIARREDRLSDLWTLPSSGSPSLGRDTMHWLRNHVDPAMSNQ